MMFLMDIPQEIILFLAAFVVSWISAIAGFGGGLLMVLTVSYFYDIKLSLALCVIYFWVNNLQKYAHNRSYVDKPFAKQSLLFGLPMCVLGLWGFYYIEADFLRYFMAGLCFYLALAHFCHFVPQVRDMKGKKLALFASLWGFFTGLANAMPIKVMMLKGRGLKKQHFVGTGAIISLAVDCLKLPGYALMGIYQWEHWQIVLPMILGSLIGNVIGKKCLDRISVEAFETLVVIMLLVGGIKFLF